MSSTYILYTTGLDSCGQSSRQSFLQRHKNPFAELGPKRKPIATLSFFLYNISKIKMIHTLLVFKANKVHS